ncbi:MAG: hypothetical protein JW724_03800 [Candidatus Altiarchaeota archaeon]|nr:hypothetical protein [Candidatus Altiarchaeota archaeon]
MKITIKVCLPARSDPVEDLDSVKSLKELKAWKDNIKGHALKIFEYEGMDERMIKDLEGRTIQECCAVIAYPHEEHHETDELSKANLVGKELLAFLKKNSSRLEWDLKETGASALSAADIAEQHRFIYPTGIWDNFTYGLISDIELKEDTYEIDLEFVMDK